MTEQPATAVVFPGQGTLHSGMRAEIEREAPELLDLLTEAAGKDAFDFLDEDAGCAQAAAVCRGIASWRTIQDELRPVAFAGHSLGEISACVAAGALSASDALSLAVVRGRLTGSMAGDGGMAAILGIDAGRAATIAASHGLSVAAYNAPQQIVVAGPAKALESGAVAAKAAGARTHRLAVHGAFHSPAMRPAVDKFAGELAKVTFRDPQAPIYSGMTGRPYISPVLELSLILAAPVQWGKVLDSLSGAGVRRIVQAAPGEVLCGLARQSHPEIDAVPATQILLELAG